MKTRRFGIVAFVTVALAAGIPARAVNEVSCPTKGSVF